jgi:hypothetical protein
MAEESKKKPLFKVGQVVRVNTAWYRSKPKLGEQYQKIVRVFVWPEYKPHPFGYEFANHDAANEKYVAALTKKESGR